MCAITQAEIERRIKDLEDGNGFTFDVDELLNMEGMSGDEIRKMADRKTVHRLCRSLASGA
jgi:hypothetical protein